VTYFEFLGLFVALPIVALLALLRGRVPRVYWLNAAALSLLALVYTAPWDNVIVLNGVWSYSAHQVLGVVIGVIPLEEYLFYILQVVATVLFFVWLRRRWTEVKG